MESKHRTYRRTDGTLGVGYLLKFADCSQACIAWPDTVPERIYAHQFEQAGIEDVTDQMPQAAVTIETRKLESHDDWPLNSPVLMQPPLAPGELISSVGETKLMQIVGDGPEGFVAAVGVTDGMHHYVKKDGIADLKHGMTVLCVCTDNGEWFGMQNDLESVEGSLIASEECPTPPVATPEIIQSNNEYIARNLADDDTKEFPLPTDTQNPQNSAEVSEAPAAPIKPKATKKAKA